MCQLTMIDTNILDTEFLSSLLALNATEGHLDGFGYYNFNSNHFFKTEKDFLTWFSSNSKESLKFREMEDIRGMYHVRFASTNKNNINKETAHPHKLGNIVLSHNGTLTRFYTKTITHILSKYDLKFENTTDSLEFLAVLHYYSYGEGSAENKGVTCNTIKTSLNLFSGNFVILIYDLQQPDRMFIAKDDKVKPLSQCVIKKGKTPVGFLLNSKWYMLESAIYIYKNILNKCKEYSFDVSEVTGDTVYEYKYGSYKLHELSHLAKFHEVPELDSAKNYSYIGNTVTGDKDTPVRDSLENKSLMSIAETELTTLYNLFDFSLSSIFLQMDDIILLYELFTGKSALDFSLDDKKRFGKLLDKIVGVSTNDKDLTFSNLVSVCGGKLNVYEKCKLQFPYTLNSIEELKKAYATVHADTP